MTWIKICGITNIEDAKKAASLRVDALGLIFAPSPRRVEPDIAKKIILALPKTLLKVGVFVNEAPEEVQRVAEYCGLNALQFHGEESPEHCQKFFYPVFKAIHIKGLESLKDMGKYHHVSILLDTYSPVQAGGTGNPFSWEIALRAKEKGNFILSGGLNPGNVGEAIKKVRPWGVDVCSGVEKVLGMKDPLKMIDFVKEVRKADGKIG
ncbi:MAG: phosphoribosylanthranilate isomerase [Syntrophaceae bacterium]|nr:phosphoribosylanthranilate isomerase [Syntrophaceae bacterium]